MYKIYCWLSCIRCSLVYHTEVHAAFLPTILHIQSPDIAEKSDATPVLILIHYCFQKFPAFIRTNSVASSQPSRRHVKIHCIRKKNCQILKRDCFCLVSSCHINKKALTGAGPVSQLPCFLSLRFSLSLLLFVWMSVCSRPQNLNHVFFIWCGARVLSVFLCNAVALVCELLWNVPAY